MEKFQRTKLGVGLFGLLSFSTLFLAGCPLKNESQQGGVTQPQVADFQLQVLHVADMDSGGDLVNNSKNISAVLTKFRSDFPNNTVFLSSGDNYIPGPFFNAGADASLTPIIGSAGAGRADIEILNRLGLQASALGNHEFDQGTAKVKDLVEASTDGNGNSWRGAQFPYLSANMDFTADQNLALTAASINDGQDATTLNNKIARYATLTVNGEKIGLVGAATPTLPNITTLDGATVSPALDANGNFDISDLAAEIQPSVNALKTAGVNKIILLAHMQQITVEEQLAPLLDGVDLIIAGGSNTRLFDNNDRIRAGDTKQGEYPKQFTSASGEPVFLVNVDADYKYLGRIVLSFDNKGVLLPGLLDPTINGAYATDNAGLADLGLSQADATAGVAAISDAILAVNQATEGLILGTTSVYLEGDRNFGRNQETNLGNLTADANLAKAQQTDPITAMSFKNGGGIRASIGTIVVPPGGTGAAQKQPPAADASVGKAQGDISRADIERALAFNNGLTLLNLTAQEVKAVLEHAIGNFTISPPSTSGRFPQIAGIRFSFDPAGTTGDRVRTIVVDDPDGNGPLTGPEVIYSGGTFKVAVNKVYRAVTLNFLADGGDGYPFNTLPNPNRLDLFNASTGFDAVGREQKALADYLLAQFGKNSSNPYNEADSGSDFTTDGRIIILSGGNIETLPQN